MIALCKFYVNFSLKGDANGMRMGSEWILKHNKLAGGKKIWGVDRFTVLSRKEKFKAGE